MRIFAGVILGLVFGVRAISAADMPEQAKRGAELFQKANKGLPCATCHQLDGKGTPAGPDLKNIAVVSPRAIATAILASRTAYVVELELTSGKKMTAIQHGEGPDGLIYWDLASNVPKEVKLKKSDIKTSRDNAKWKHPPESTGYSNQELADVIAYIKFITRGSTDEVTADAVKR